MSYISSVDSHSMRMVVMQKEFMEMYRSRRQTALSFFNLQNIAESGSRDGITFSMLDTDSRESEPVTTPTAALWGTAVLMYESPEN